MKRNVLVEKAMLSDAEEILALQKLAFQSEAFLYADYSLLPLIQTLEDIRQEFAGRLLLKALTDGTIVGSVRAFVKRDTCFVSRLVVHPSFQKRGIGSTLITRIEGCFKKAKRFEIFTGYKSERNILLYKKFGYTTFKTQKVTDTLSLVLMEKVTGWVRRGAS